MLPCSEVELSIAVDVENPGNPFSLPVKADSEQATQKVTAFVEQFNGLENWEQAMILSSLQRLVAMMDATSIRAAAVLSAEPFLDDSTKSANTHPNGL